MGLTWTLALRNILRNKRRTGLTVLLISCTLVALMFTDAYMQAMGDVMIRSATRLYPGDGQIHNVAYRAEMDAKEQISNVAEHIENLKKTGLVSGYSLRALDFGMVSSTANNLPVQVVGIDADLEKTVSKLALSIEHGDYLDNDGGDNQILIGAALADLLEVELGDRLVVSLNNYQTDEIEQRLFRVSGIFNLHSRFFDEGLVFIKLSMAQTMLGLGDNVHEIAFNLYDESLSGDETLPFWEQQSTDDTVAEGWKKLMPDLASMMDMLNYSLFIVAAILFVVAVLGVINAMFMSIYERTYEFGVILAIGTRRSSVFVLILVEGLMLAIISLLIGTLLGGILINSIGAIGIDYGNMDFSGVALAEVIRPETRMRQFTSIPFSVFVMTMVACIYPAVNAARIVPATALHKSL
ncbi:MAG: FtsX-like permease family protein [Reinekea sp.]|jgi:ABC-type lipoprotein release transport system permease subunit